MSTAFVDGPSVQVSTAPSGVSPKSLLSPPDEREELPLSFTESPSFASAENGWMAVPLRERLRFLREARYLIAEQAESLARTLSPTLARSQADTLVAEILPLLDACKFLERNAERLLKPTYLGRRGRPFWLAGVQAEVHRVPLGRVLVIGPGNFPLFLPGVQVLQALIAGNTVVWKPGVGGEAVARYFASVLGQAGFPAEALQVTGEDVECATRGIASAPDKVVFTGSSRTGRRVLEQLAPRLIPAVLELSGTDAVIVLASADLRRVAKAIAFGLRLNGGAVCMSPRRVLGTSATLGALEPLLIQELKAVPAVAMDEHTARRLSETTAAATLAGARIVGVLCPEAQRPVLVHGAQPTMAIAREAFFAPVLALITAPGDHELASLHNESPHALTASIFGEEKAARALATNVRAGSVLINDLIAPTADARLPFGGRGESGYGVTRGAEGLLEMTAVKVIQTRTTRSTRHYEATRNEDIPFFAGLIRAVHARSFSQRVQALRAVVTAARSRRKASSP